MSSTANNGYSLLIVARLQQAPETADEFLAGGLFFTQAIPPHAGNWDSSFHVAWLPSGVHLL